MITDDRDACYEAMKSKDSRFDGRFFVGITSTGIYCRPVCHARLPKKENCVFFRTSAEAERAGFRPCLLCRPELAPGSSPMDASSALARRAARLVRDTAGENLALEDIAARLGCSTRHLRRVFMDEWQVSPIAYRETCRLLLAKQLLTDTRLPVLDVAMASGFGSVRRLNEAFQAHYHLTPTRLRKETPEGGRRADLISVSLGYRPPFAWENLLAFFAARAIQGVEQVKDGAYERTVRLQGRDGKTVSGWLRVEQDQGRNALRLTLPDTLAPVFPQVIAKVRALFDTDSDPSLIESRLKGMNREKEGLFLPGVRIPGCFDPFETAVRAIIGQQVTVHVAGVLAGRIAQQLGPVVETGRAGLDHAFPSPEAFVSPKEEDQMAARLGGLGVVRTRSRCIIALARAVTEGRIHLSRFADPEAEIVKLKAIPGIGDWTAKYIAMRTMGWTDAFLETDAGIRHALADMSDAGRIAWAEAWRPWRSYATVCLWNSLG